MSGGFEVDVDRLGARAGEFGGFAERAGRIAAELGRSLDSAGQTWGEDAVGRSFAAAHDEPSAEALRRGTGLAEGLGGVGGKLTDAANAYRAGDEDARGRLDRDGLGRNDAG